MEKLYIKGQRVLPKQIKAVKELAYKNCPAQYIAPVLGLTRSAYLNEIESNITLSQIVNGAKQQRCSFSLSQLEYHQRSKNPKIALKATIFELEKIHGINGKQDTLQGQDEDPKPIDIKINIREPKKVNNG